MTFSECVEKFGNKASKVEKPIAEIDRGVCEGENHGFIRLIYTKGQRFETVLKEPSRVVL